MTRAVNTSASFRWTFLLGILLVLIIGPFLIFESAISSQASQLLESEFAPALTSVLIAISLALDVLLPIPSSLVSTASGALLGFVGGTLVCWVGMSLGCLLGYWIGATGGTTVIQRLLGERELEKAADLAQRIGLSALVMARAVPVLAEASTIAAGAARIPWREFVLVTSLANLGIAAVYAAIGAYALDINSFLLAFAGAIAIPALGIAMARLLPGLALPLGRAAIGTGNSFAGSTRESGSSHDVTFSVNFDYPVIFTHDALSPENRSFVDVVSKNEPEKRHKIIVFIDSGVADARPDITDLLTKYVQVHKTHMQLLAPPVHVPGGEGCKEDSLLLDKIHDVLSNAGIDRHSFVVCIGGGAVLDVVGYAAATAHRGVRLIRFPSTVLAQNDAGVGVKNGINKFRVKNFAGTFQPPFAVINDFQFLNTLNTQDRRSGLAEAIKVALIRDVRFFEFLEANAEALSLFESTATEEMIRRCAELHLAQISKGGDPFETGSARPLDYGHWSAHKLETLTSYHLRHGEAVAIGIALDAHYSVLAGLLTKGEDNRICILLEHLGFRLWHPVLEKKTREGKLAILQGLKDFQEHLGGELTVTLVQDIGVGIEVNEMDHGLVGEAIGWLKIRQTP